MLTKRQRDWMVKTPYYKRYKRRVPLTRTPAVYLGKELKFVDYEYNGSIAQTNWQRNTPAVGCLNAIPQGAGESERIGRKITQSSLHIRGRISNTSTQSRKCRVLIVKDTQTNGAAFTPADVMATAGVAGSVDSFRNLDNVSRFDVLFDKTFTINPGIAFDGTQLVSNNAMASFAFNVNLSGHVNFNGPTADLSEIVDNSYHVISVSWQGSLSLAYTSRFRFYG